MIITTLENFLLSVPTASGTEYNAIKPFVESADSEIQALLCGKDLYDYIALHSELSLFGALRDLIAFTAYKNAIPFVDLIQTNNGFAVVSNNNQAPASKERVERLIAQCSNIIDITTDKFITQVVGFADALTEWTKAGCFPGLTNCLFLTGYDYGQYGKSTKRSNFLAEKGLLITAQNTVLAPLISKDYLNALIVKVRAKSMGEKDLPALDFCKQILSRYVANDHDNVKLLNDQLANLLESDLVGYKTYADSKEYALKTGANYQNKKSDSTFFFGT